MGSYEKKQFDRPQQVECPPFELGPNSRLIFAEEHNIEPQTGEVVPNTGRSSRRNNQLKIS